MLYRYSVGIYQENELKRCSSGNVRPQSSELAVLCKIPSRVLITACTLKKKKIFEKPRYDANFRKLQKDNSLYEYSTCTSIELCNRIMDSLKMLR